MPIFIQHRQRRLVLAALRALRLPSRLVKDNPKLSGWHEPTQNPEMVISVLAVEETSHYIVPCVW